MPRSRLLFSAAFPIVLACTLAGSARAGPWTLSASAGGMFASYDAVGRPFFDPDWTAALSSTRALGSRFALRGTAGWSRYGRDLPLLFGEEAVPNERQTVNSWRAGLGVRVFPEPRHEAGVRGYLDLAPVLLWSRWADHYTVHGWDFGGHRVDIDEVETQSRLLAGIEAGAGCEWRPEQHLRPALGVRFLATTGPGHVSVVSGEALRGLLELAAEASIGWSP